MEETLIRLWVVQLLSTESRGCASCLLLLDGPVANVFELCVTLTQQTQGRCVMQVASSHTELMPLLDTANLLGLGTKTIDLYNARNICNSKSVP